MARRARSVVMVVWVHELMGELVSSVGDKAGSFIRFIRDIDTDRMTRTALALIAASSAFAFAPQARTAPRPRPLAYERKPTEPYVPDGLTRDEYAKLRKREAAAQAKLDFGRVGPRWDTSAKPADSLFGWSTAALWRGGIASPAPGARRARRRRLAVPWRAPPLPSALAARAALAVRAARATLTAVAANFVLVGAFWLCACVTASFVAHGGGRVALPSSSRALRAALSDALLRCASALKAGGAFAARDVLRRAAVGAAVASVMRVLGRAPRRLGLAQVARNFGAWLALLVSAGLLVT